MRILNRIAMLTICLAAGVSLCRAEDWQEIKGEHFIVRYLKADASNAEGFAQDVAGKAETYYRRIAEDLGYPRYSEFWTWDNRVKIYLYPDQASYVRSGNHPQWSAGMADYEKKQIISFSGSTRFSEHVLPHEIAHLIFRDFVGFTGEIPLWLDEGVAQWEEESLRPDIKRVSKLMFEKDSLLTLDDMMTLDVRTINPGSVYQRPTVTRSGQKAVIVLSGDALVNHFYVEASSLVGFFIERFGSLEFAKFCRQLRDGNSFEQAVQAVYSGLRSLADVEKEWKRYLEAG
ncbi:MAG TPA: hypothetical protein P5110_03085 [Candidatus Omnitrophota bacterium]|nr:hypothetical protein [Candidatus Omnitrophota bacterium]HRZ14473.1 hypothetical protein [Candidatus Omnitrophota bacterium]